MKTRVPYLFTFLLVLVLAVSACGVPPEEAEEVTEEEPVEEEEAPEDEEADDEEAPEDEEADDEAMDALPGEGIEVNMGRATWDTGWFQAAIYSNLLQEMGYEVGEPATLDNPAFYLSAARGDLDFWPNGWFPLHTTFLEDEDVEGQVELVGFQVEAGALQGYLVDKATADELGITNLDDFKDPEIAAAFDSDGNGQADLIGCNPGWGCEAVIDHHLETYELGDSVEHVQGEYSALMADTIARFERGEPVLFYTWTPNWTIAELAPGEDVVWIEVPFSSLPDEEDVDTSATGIDGCVSDPCDMGFPPNDIRVVANSEFLEENPTVERLFQLVEIPLADIAGQNQLMLDGEDGDEDIQRHAEEWIEENRDQIDEWMTLAMDLEAELPMDDEAMMEEEATDDAAAEEEAMEEEATDDTAAEEEAMEEEATEDEAMAMPGEGIEVAMGRATWDTGWFQAELYRQMLQELGYEVEEPATLDNPAFYLSTARGDLDFWPNGWFPIHDPFVNDEEVAGRVELVGFQVEAGALQGYLVDKASADELGITSLEDFKDPEIAAVFDGDGNGQADLIGCNAGWGCELVIEHHLDAYELRDSIEHVQGEYSTLMADTIARFQRGEPILFYTWTPNWTVSELALGEDVVWIEVPFSSLPDEEDVDTEWDGIEGCVSDPCDMGFPPNDIRVVANSEFLAENPAAAELFEVVEIPLADIAAQNARMIGGEDSEADIANHATEWIEENRDLVDEWLNAAREAAS